MDEQEKILTILDSLTGTLEILVHSSRDKYAHAAIGHTNLAGDMSATLHQARALLSEMNRE